MQHRSARISQGRRPSRPAEAEFYDLAASHGFLLTQRGWPSYFLELNGSVAVVQLKPASSRDFRPDKQAVLEALCAAGIPCFAWAPDSGLVRLALDGRGGLGGDSVLEEIETAGTLTEQFSSLVELLQTSRGSGGSAERVFGDEPDGDPASTASSEAAPDAPSPSEVSAVIDAVWETYVAVMKPRRTAAGEGERLIIRNAVRACDIAAAVDELSACIRGCAESDYHMKRGQFANRPGQKYNSIGKILKPRPRLGETQRSRIDWWLDRAKSTGVAGFPSADPAILRQRQLEVQRGHQSDNPDTVRKAKVAESWLSEHGVETIREGDALPTFRRIGARREA